MSLIDLWMKGYAIKAFASFDLFYAGHGITSFFRINNHWIIYFGKMPVKKLTTKFAKFN